MENNNVNGATVCVEQNQKNGTHFLDGLIESEKDDYSKLEFDSNQRFAKSLIKFFTKENRQIEENQSFIKKLDRINRFRWICINQKEFSSINDEILLITQNIQKLENKNLNIYFETKNQNGDHLIVIKCEDFGNKNNIFFKGIYLRTHKIEKRTFYYSLYMFHQEYKKISHLKNAVARFEMKRNQFGIESKFK